MPLGSPSVLTPGMNNTHLVAEVHQKWDLGKIEHWVMRAVAKLEFSGATFHRVMLFWPVHGEEAGWQHGSLMFRTVFSLDEQSYLGAWKCAVFFCVHLFLLLLGTCNGGGVGRFKVQWKIALPERLGLQGLESQRNKKPEPRGPFVYQLCLTLNHLHICLWEDSSLF